MRTRRGNNAVQQFLMVVLAVVVLEAPGRAGAADRAFYELDTAVIDARIRSAFANADPFAAAKVVGLMFAEKIAVGGNAVAREAILTGLENESVRFRKQMPDFRIAERDLFVAQNGVVMTGRMMGTRADGGKMDTDFVTVFTRDKTGRIVTQSTMEAARKAPQAKPAP